MTGQHLPPAGWHPDPHDAAQLRYWDGTTWTHDTRPVQTPQAHPGHPQFSGTPGAPPPPQQQKKRRSMAVWAIPAGIALLAAGVGIGYVGVDWFAPDDEPAAPQAATASAQAVKNTISCPQGTDELYDGATAQLAVKVCHGPVSIDQLTYIGGNDDLGYLRLDAEFDQSIQGYVARNGATTYTVTPEALRIERPTDSGDVEELVNDRWLAGTMKDINVDDEYGLPPGT